jgi:hypothetical protein
VGRVTWVWVGGGFTHARVRVGGFEGVGHLRVPAQKGHARLEAPYRALLPHVHADCRPKLAKMALGFLTAPGTSLISQPEILRSLSIWPASSVDTERAFSAGRLQVNHLQHAMSSQMFRAQIAVGSWSGTPLMPDLKIIKGILDKKRKDKGKGKEKEKATPIVIDSDDSD